MRVAWVHPTWRDLVIERLADDALLRRHFLNNCGPHGIALALSTRGGAEGGRQLPLIGCDEDWDAVGDRIYAMAPELDARETTIVLTAIDDLLEAARDDPMLAGECAALAGMVLARFGEMWAGAHAIVALPCIDAWLSVAARLNPRPWPTFLAATWAELLPVDLPDPADLPEVQRFTDWRTLCDVVATFSPDLLDDLGYGAPQRALMRAFRERRHKELQRLAQVGASPVSETFIAESRARTMDDHVVRRVLADI